MAVTVTGTNGAESINSLYPGWTDAEPMHIIALRGNDTITGGDFEQDTIEGGGGDDVITAYMGEIHGGTGDDLYRLDEYTYRDVAIFENADEGYDWIRFDQVDFAIGSYIIADNVEKMTSFLGGGGVTITGNAADNHIEGRFSGGSSGGDHPLIEGLDGNDFLRAENNRAVALEGGAGDDTLQGGSDNDTLIGGSGDDIIHVERAREVVTEGIEEGFDTLISTVDLLLADNVEKLILAGTGLKGVGNSLDNVLVGEYGADTLNGAEGADTMRGGAGSDLYIVNHVGDRVIDYDGDFDLIRTSVTFNMSAGIDRLTMTGSDDINSRGNDLDNFMAGNRGDNVLRAEGGADTLIGGQGDDVLKGGDGADRFEFTAMFDSDRIVDFADGELITFTTDVFADFDDVMANATETVNGVRLDAGVHGRLLIADVTLESLTEDDFGFSAG